MPPTTKRVKLIILLTVFFSLFSLRTIFDISKSNLQDFTYYLGSAHNLLAGTNPYLTDPPQVYPPASLLLFVPLSLLPLYISKIIWLTLSLVSLFLGLHYFSLYIFKNHSSSLSFILFILSLQTFPVKYALAQGQINFLVFLGFALFFHFLSRHKNHLAGLTLSLIVILKFNPLFLLLYLLIIRNTKPIPVFIISYVFLNLFIDLFSPSPLNNSFLQSITNMSTHYSGYYFNTSLAALSIRYFPQSLAAVVNLILSAIVWLITLFTSHHKKHNLTTFSLFLVAILLTSPITWQHYLFWSLPAFLIVANQTRSRVILFCTLISFLLLNINVQDPQSITIRNLLYSHVTFGLIWLLLILLYVQNSSRNVFNKPV